MYRRAHEARKKRAAGAARTSRVVPGYLIVRYARENAQEAAASRNFRQLETDFLDRHMLNWVPLASAKLARLSPSTFGPFMTLLATFLKTRRDEVANLAG